MSSSSTTKFFTFSISFHFSLLSELLFSIHILPIGEEIFSLFDTFAKMIKRHIILGG